MSNQRPKIAVCSLGLVWLSLSLFLANFSFAVEIGELEKYSEKDYGPEYFYAIKGEVSGQAAPGIKAVYVNGRPVAIGANQTFKTNVSLKEGQKYLIIETHYENWRFIKKYLVIRHPKAKKTFKINVPEKEFKKIIAKAKAPAKPAPTTTTTTVAKPKPKPIPQVAAKPKPKPIAKPQPKPVPKAKPKPVVKPKPQPQAAPSFGFKEREFKSKAEIQALTQAIKKDDYGITSKSPAKGTKQINEVLRRPDFYDNWKTKKKNVLLSQDAYRLIGETESYRSKPFNQLTKEQQQKIIRLNRRIIEATYTSIAPKSRAPQIKAKAEAAAKPVAAVPKIRPMTDEEKWLGYEFVAELEADRLLIVKRVNGKYFGGIMALNENVWIPLQEINRQEFIDLLEKGTIPPSFVPEDKI